MPASTIAVRARVVVVAGPAMSSPCLFSIPLIIITVSPFLVLIAVFEDEHSAL
jgi:hypothetical protein